MKLKFDVQWHVVAILGAVVVLGFRGPAILESRAWSRGRATTIGRTNDVIESWVKGRRMVEIKYSYEVGGVQYKGSEFGGDSMLEQVPVKVTYAPANPDVSTIFPDRIDSIIRTSVIVAIVAVLPMLLMWLLELLHFMRGASRARTSSD